MMEFEDNSGWSYTAFQGSPGALSFKLPPHGDLLGNASLQSTFSLLSYFSHFPQVDLLVLESTPKSCILNRDGIDSRGAKLDLGGWS